MMQVLTQVLCRLLSNPQYIEPLRQEADTVIAEEGWTKAGIDKMRKLDSFLRETNGLILSVSVCQDSLYSSPLTDTCSSSESDSSRSAPIHIFQRGDHPGGHISGGSVLCYSYG